MSEGCKSTKLVPPGQHLLVKNKLKTSDTGNNLFRKLIGKLDDDKALYIKHKPNRKIIVLGRFHLGLYNLGSSVRHPEKNDSVRWRKLLRSYGEAPVILDTNEINKSKDNLKNYLFSKGFFDCDITHRIDFKGKKAHVTYYINPDRPYLISKVNYAADDAEIDFFLNRHAAGSLLKSGQILDVEQINAERNRITNLLRNSGYYDFTKDYIDFELDTLGKAGHTLNINITVANKSETERFGIRYIRNVKVWFENDSETHVNTIPVRYRDIDFYFNGFPLRPHVIAKNISISEGSAYSMSETENTYNRLSEFQIFKFIDIGFTPSLTDSVSGLDVTITLKTNYRQSFTIEPQGIVSQLNRIQNINLGNSYGVANSLIWTHRNLLGNAEVFEISANTRIETQLYRDTVDKKIKYFNPAYQQSFNLTLSIPKGNSLSWFLFPLVKLKLVKPLDEWTRVKSIKTNFNLSFLFEKNPDYLRRILPLTYQYQVQTKRSTWFFNVFEVSFSKNTLSIDISGRTDSAFIKRLFSNNIITSSGLNFLFTNKNTARGRTHFIIRTNLIELGGNLHRMVRRLADPTDMRDTSYSLLKVDYYQYARSEIDARCSTVLDDNQSTIIRFNLGFTYPYGNKDVVPFDKLFFIGGSNSLRAWRPRTIGPGSYSESSKNFRIDRAGDLIIQANAEYRFDIFKRKLEGAVFVDAGNVWLMRNVNNTNPLKLFKPANFIGDLAMNTGLGLRIDFEFFLFRLDWGMQMKNPEKPVGQNWVIREFARNNYFTKYSILNFGIGYPF